MSEPRGPNGRWIDKRTTIVRVRLNSQDKRCLTQLLSSGVAENVSDAIRYALHNCANDETLNLG